MKELAYIPAILITLTLLCAFSIAQAPPRSSPSAAIPSGTSSEVPDAPQSETQSSAAVTPSEFLTAVTLSNRWANDKSLLDEKAARLVKIGSATIGIVAAGVGGAMRLDKHYTRAGTAVTAGGGVLGGGLNLYALIAYREGKHHLEAQNSEIPQSIKSYIRTQSPQTNIQTLPSHPAQFSDILNRLQLDKMMNTMHQQ